MNQVTVTLPDGAQQSVVPGTPVIDVAARISPRLADAALAAVVDDRLVDLAFPLTTDARVRIVTDKSAEALPLYRHSTAHLLAAAVTALFPGTQCGIGPPTDEGFFYDFVVGRPFVPEDLDAIEQKMRELAAADLPYERQMWPREEARAFFASRGEPLKVQLIDEKTAGQSHVSCYTIKDKETFIDFCVGPHVPSSGKLKAFKLLSTSNAYWKGDAKGVPMQRVYGTAFASEKELKAHLTQIEEAKTRDHRKVGRETGLFMFHPWAPGAAFWLAKGTTLYNTLAGYMREVLFPSGYVEVKTPLIFNKALWETSGHWQHYRQNMFLVEAENEPMGVKAMNCPGHMLVFGSEVRSYRDLPIRLHEQTPLHRNEASGVLSGLTRVRQFAQDDAHCFVTEDQIASEVESLLKLVQRVYADFGLEVLGEALDEARGVPGRDCDVGSRRGVLAARARGGQTGVYDQCRRRRVLRAEGRFRRDGRARPEMAVRDDSTRLPDPAAVRPEIYRRRQRRAPSGRHPPGDLRQLRALHCPPDRALWRGFSVVARPAAGPSAADCRPPSGLRPDDAGAAGRGWITGRGRRAAGEDRV